MDSQIYKCPKCGKDYSGNPHWKANLKKHLERKNPCDRKDEKYIRESKIRESKKQQDDTLDLYSFLYFTTEF